MAEEATTQNPLAVHRLPSLAKFAPNSRLFTRHTMPSRFHAKSLKTNDGRTSYSTHISRRARAASSRYVRQV
jgi:hypothetical protein